MIDRDHVLKAAGAVARGGVIRHFGSATDERDTLAEGVGLIDADHRDRVSIIGPDAASFLDRLLTVGVKTLEPGQGAPAYMLDARGRIQLAFDLYRLDGDHVLTDATPGHGAAIIERLDMFHFGEQLRFEPGVGAHSALELHGPRAADALAAMGLPVPEAPGDHATGQIGGVDVRALRRDRTGGPGFVLMFPPAGYADVWRAASQAGARPVGFDALDAARIEAGQPAHPEELGPHATPLEMGTMAGITEGKGCYPGQEVIERTIALGRPARTLMRLDLDGHAAAGDTLVDGGGKPAGTLTSVAARGPEMVALALVKHRAAKAGGPWHVGDTTARQAAASDSTEGS